VIPAGVVVDPQEMLGDGAGRTVGMALTAGPHVLFIGEARVFQRVVERGLGHLGVSGQGASWDRTKLTDW
jgi:hypothetical protein